MRGSWFCTERVQREDMTYLNKIVLACRAGYVPAIDALVEDFMRDRVTFVGVVGQDCCKVEDIIDEIVVGDGAREPYSMLTSSHPGKSVAEAVEFAKSLTGEFAGNVQVVEV